MATSDLVERARDWAAADPDPHTRRELLALIGSGDFEELADRMGGTLEFGTAGLRGKVEAGSNRMNRAVVIRATAGLARVLLDRAAGVVDRPVVVGRDARPSSEAFAADTIGVLAAAGIPVLRFPGIVPTPLVAFSAKRHQAAAAVVITASHNPPADNGYKVYDRNAAQIIPPLDTEIAHAIRRVGPASLVPRIDPAGWERSGLVREVPADTERVYLEEVMAARPPVSPGMQRIVYTPLHGVGGALAMRALATAGHSDVTPVPEQIDPDGRFPTVRFPNPEEPGALDLAETLASRIGADLILANDPDADRLAVALPAPGGWRQLTGNQTGVLLADHLLEASPAEPAPIVVSSIVSTPMLGEVAAAHRARWEVTLTGFKWICNAALALEAEGVGRFVFGFEEALGYTVDGVVRDKDGISAAVVMADLAASLAGRGSEVWDRLADLARRHGHWVSAQLSVAEEGPDGPERIAAGVERAAADPPARLGGTGVSEMVDLRRGGRCRPPWLPDTDLVELRLGEAGRVLVRPSGTEPKLKVYVDLRLDPPPAGGFHQAEDEGRRRASAVARELTASLGL